VVWFRVDDTFLGHPKAVGLSNDALATWTRAGDWCAWQLTDGAFERGQLREFAGDAADPEAVAADLLRRRLWEPGAEDGLVQFHDWGDWNPTRAQVLAKRKADAERRRRWLAGRRDPATGRAAAGHGVSNAVTDDHAVSNAVTDPDHAVSNAVTGPGNAVAHTSPTRPEGSVGTYTGANPPSQRNARDAVTDDDEGGDPRTAIENAVMAYMTGAGHPVNRPQAAALIEMALAGRKPRDPGAYVLATLKKDPAAALRRVATSRQPPPAREVLPDARRPGGPSADVAVRAAEARALLHAATSPAPPLETADDLPDW
jgi:hypothetical protein